MIALLPKHQRFIWTTVRADYGDEQTTPNHRRCRFIVHTADLSAPDGGSAIPANV
jgi:hypothetical protein